MVGNVVQPYQSAQYELDPSMEDDSLISHKDLPRAIHYRGKSLAPVDTSKSDLTMFEKKKDGTPYVVSKLPPMYKFKDKSLN